MYNSMLVIVNKILGEDAKIVKIKTEKEPFKFVKFGGKKFFKHIVKVEVKGQVSEIVIIEKQLPESDVSMLFTQDKNYRELLFLQSDLRKAFERFFVIPVIDVNSENRQIFMEECVQDLKSFGPPILPTLEQMKGLITRIAIKDARMRTMRVDYAQEYLSAFDLIKRMFNDKLTDAENALISKDWPWFLPGAKKLVKHIGNARYENWRKIYESTNVAKVFASVPFTLHHGDFYFANIGFNPDTKPVVIDWECLTWGPIGYDFVTLTYAIPPLAFTDQYEEWYISAYNNACDDELTMQQFLNITDLIKKYHFLIADTIDAIRFSFSNEAKFSLSEQNARIHSYIKRLELYI
ncbi:MAG: phosphotransferase [Candidatus Cloacimonetes bacterium]|nr:phosphotransferase [Candidatus Cloacimonadota bacterium]